MHEEQPEHKVYRVMLDPLVLKAQQVLRDPRAQQEQQGRRACKAYREFKEFRVLKVFKAKRVILAQLVLKVL